ncbi:MAG: FAD-dependent oxidoreductase [Proteobacteria bacterium]|nr:FAD-dependent oxidoreductase [Pseudomonadota bacterium]
MFYRLHEISIHYDQNPEKELPRALAARLGDTASRLTGFCIVQRSIDARQKPVKLVFSIDVELKDGPEVCLPNALEPPPTVPLEVQPGKVPLNCRPVVVGGGPAGLFATLLLAEHGFSPMLLERGGNVVERQSKINRFLQTRNPNPECNALFGLGGAGTFSDGKLTTGIRHPWLTAVLDVLVDCGAPKSILIDAKPHIGTDVLSKVVENLIERITRAGGTVQTSVCVNEVHSNDRRLEGLGTTAGRIDAEAAVFAIGHSAPDTWFMLANAGLEIEPKTFQMGIRVEHPQEWLDKVRYRGAAGHPALGAADYKLATKVRGTPVFSFCMCPGGETIPTVNEPGHLAINGMSTSARDSDFASSGLVVSLPPQVYGGTDLSSCLEFRRRIEKDCFKAGGSDYSVPAQRLVDFAEARMSSGPLSPTSYVFDVVPARIDEILPSQIADPLRSSLDRFDHSLKGYLHPEALALAPESRASSPVRIIRNQKTREAPTLTGIYPAGEGAGYAGGIMSSALDGLEAARKIIEGHAPPQY